MSIEFNCQACGRLLRVPEGSGGKQAKCPHCESVMHIPGDGSGESEGIAGGPSEEPGTGPPSGPAPQAPTDDLFGSSSEDDPLGLGGSTGAQSDPLAPSQPESVFDDSGAGQPSGYGVPAAGYSNTTAGYGGGASPYQSPQPVGGYAAPMGMPHRGGIVLTFGILSICFSAIGSPSACGPVCCYIPTVFLLLGLGFGIPAWLMGQRDLKLIGAGQMDPNGHGTTKAGFITGMIGVILAVACFVMCVVVSVIMIIPSLMDAP